MNEKKNISIRLPFLSAFLALAVLVLFSFAALPARDFGRGPAPRAILPDPDIDAESAIVRFAGEKIPVLKRRERKRLAPASLTKIMSAAIAAEHLGPGDEIIFSAEAKNTEEKKSSARAGEVFLPAGALAMALIASDNDAALALAEAVGKKAGGGSFEDRIKRFVGLMNKKVQTLGMAGTHFENPTGLDGKGHFSSAEDLARLAEYVATKHPDLWEISRTPLVLVYSRKSTAYEIKTTDDLLYEFPGIAGSKTGFTDRAQGALLLLYPVPGRGTAIIVLLRSHDRFGDGRRIIRWLEANERENF